MSLDVIAAFCVGIIVGALIGFIVGSVFAFRQTMHWVHRQLEPYPFLHHAFTDLMDALRMKGKAS